MPEHESTNSKTKKSKRNDYGCLYLCVVCVVACILLAVNREIVISLYQWYKPSGPPVFNNLKFEQGVTFVVPLLMILVEYFIFDLAIDFFSSRFRSS